MSNQKEVSLLELDSSEYIVPTMVLEPGVFFLLANFTCYILILSFSLPHISGGLYLPPHCAVDFLNYMLKDVYPARDTGS